MIDTDMERRLAPSGAHLATTPGGEHALRRDPMAAHEGLIRSFLDATSDASEFFQPSAELLKTTRELLKVVYCVSQIAKSEISGIPQANGSNQQLHVDGFDPEQIWAMLEQQTPADLNKMRNALKNVPDDVTLLDEEMEDAVDELLGEGSDSSGSSPDDGESEEHEEDAPQTKRQSRKGAQTSAPNVEEFTEGDYDAMLAEAASGLGDEKFSSENGESSGREGIKEGQAGGELLPAEDDFLRLANMEAFVQQAEAAEELGDRGGLSSYRKVEEQLEGSQGGELGDATAARRRGRLGRWQEEEQSESEGGSASEIDLFADVDSESDDERGESGGSGVGITYEQFFGHRAGVARGATAGGDKGAADHVAATSDSGIDRAAGTLVASTAEHGRGGAVSTHQLHTARIQEQIASMEEAAMRQQGWQFRGEASAGGRPVDSALAVDLDYEQTLRPPPLPTVEASVALEDIIKARIRELRFDNVVNVEVAAPRKERKMLELDDGRSRTGLAELYEEPGQSVLRSGGVSADQQEAKKLFMVLKAKLDGLSHLGLGRKPVTSELEVNVDAAAIAMEDVAPVIVSAAHLRAPEEVHAKKRKEVTQKAEAELTQGERKQRRASKKRVQKRKVAEREVVSGIAAHPKGIKSAREDAAAAKQAQVIKKRKRKGAAHASASSSAVFRKLEEEKAAGGVQKGLQKSGEMGAQVTSAHLLM